MYCPLLEASAGTAVLQTHMCNLSFFCGNVYPVVPVHRTFTALFEQNIPKIDDSPALTLTWPLKTEPSFVKAKWAPKRPQSFSSVCHFFSCSTRDEINVTCNNKAVLLEVHAGWGKSKECVKQIKGQKKKKLSSDSTDVALFILEISSRATVASRISPPSLSGSMLNRWDRKRKNFELQLGRLMVSQSQTFLLGDLICHQPPPPPLHTQKTDTFV